jgi:hypothetical protein
MKGAHLHLPLSNIKPVIQRTGGNQAGEQRGKIMKKCTFTEDCPFFNDQLQKMHTAKEREDLKRKFCGSGSTVCARFIIAEALGLQEVPENLFPEDLFKVNLILGMP